MGINMQNMVAPGVQDRAKTIWFDDNKYYRGHVPQVTDIAQHVIT